MARLMVVDDEPSISWGLKQLGVAMGHEVRTVCSAEEGLELAAQYSPQVVLLDVRLPGMSGLAAMQRLRERLGAVPILVMTAYGDLETAVEAVRRGAFEYVVKPFDLDFIQRALTRALQSTELAGTASPVSRNRAGIIGRSPAMQDVFKKIALAAASHAGVLVSGESGTGKELVARAIHEHSDRAGRPFVAVNLAALNSALAESELFGHIQGAFTGADQDRMGLLVQANGGTLFLDEVADIPVPVQVKLLRALEQGEVTPVGSSKAIPTSFRIISATHRNLLRQVSSGEFRHDLYFRLGAFRIEIPPLRERPEDIQELAEYFLAAAGTHRQDQVARFSPRAIAELQRRPWYGNVRELRHAVEHALVVSRGGIIETEHLPEVAQAALFGNDSRSAECDDSIRAMVRRWADGKLSQPDDPSELHSQLMQLVEPPLLSAAMERNHGQCATAARQVGMHRMTLKKKLDEYGLASDS